MNEAMNSQERQEVWVAISGCYSNTGVAGVYSTPQKAMEAHPVLDPLPAHVTVIRPGGWREENGWWDNGLDWDYAMHLEPYWLDADV